MSDNLFVGDQLNPSVSTIQKATTAPEFYTDYLQNVTNLGANAVENGGVAGLSPLTIQAMNMAPTTAFAGAGTLANAADLSGAAGTTGAYDIVNNYMNPYVNNVVDEMGRLQQQNIQRNVMPGLSAANAAMGNFGSKRQAVATGQTMTDMQSNLIGQQYGALNTGYTDAMKAAQNDLTRQLDAGKTLSNIGTNQNTVGTQGLKTMTDLGSIQRSVAQEALDRPMEDAQKYAKLLQGYQIPTSSTEQTTSSGGYENSPLSNILGITTLIDSYNKTTNPNSSLTDAQTYNNIAASAKNLGLTLTADGKYTNGTSNYSWNGSSFVPSPAEGGSINNYAMGGGVGSINGQMYNDGNIDASYDGGYTFDQYGNLIG
jgi:hypothetical protein